jgi:polyisoprenoid-binding protein YceI
MYRQMLKWMFVASLAVVLAACGGTAATTPAAGSASQPATTATAPAATSTDASTTATAPAAQGTAAQTDGAARTFTIVPEQTEASYAVQEQFLDRNLPNQAVGKTNAVEGQFQFTADGQPSGQVTKIAVDLRTLTSDSSMRDRRIQSQWLESTTYPFAEFVSTGVEGVPAGYAEGQQVSFKLLGNMTIHGVTKPVTFDITGALAGDTVTGTATTQIQMTDFGFDPPSIAGILTVENDVTVTVNFTAVEAA